MVSMSRHFSITLMPPSLAMCDRISPIFSTICRGPERQPSVCTYARRSIPVDPWTKARFGCLPVSGLGPVLNARHGFVNVIGVANITPRFDHPFAARLLAIRQRPHDAFERVAHVLVR